MCFKRATSVSELRMNLPGRATWASQGALIGSLTLLAACSPKVQPIEVAKPQRQAMEQAKAIEGVLRTQSDEQRRTIDAASR